jgi:Na+/proline symporter
MGIFDWLIVVIPLTVVLYFGIKTRKLATSVADFLAARRVAGRYLLCVANLEAGQGLVSLVSMWEMYFVSGFAIIFWYNLTAPLTLIFSLFGYCIYRFRETRAMTMGHFLEMRYNRSFRITAATIQVFTGIFSYSLFPAVGARCIMYFCNLPEHYQVFGLQCSTFVSLVILFLSVAVIVVCIGGQVTVMVTDCIQGLISYPLYAILVFYFLWRFSWGGDVMPALMSRSAGQSMVNPYDIKELRSFNLFWVVSGILGSLLGRMSWSGSQGYQGAALNPHEQKMGMMIGGFRAGFSSLMTLTLAVGAITFLTGQNFTNEANQVYANVSRKVVNEMLNEPKYATLREDLNQMISTNDIPKSLQERLDDNDKYTPVKELTPKKYSYIIQSSVATIDRKKAQSCGSISQQMLVPVAVSHILPTGLMGILCVVMIFLMLSTDTTSLHSWGSIFIQDIILPFRKTEISREEHIRLLRLSICFVALCALAGSVLFVQTDFILMFFTIATAIWMAGSGPVITLGLYWKRGTTAGAYASLISGSIIAISGILLQQNWVKYIYPFLESHNMVPMLTSILETISRPFNPYIVWTMTPQKFPINSMELNFLALLTSLLLYVIVSLATCKSPFDLEALLHRDKTAKQKLSLNKKIILNRLFGIDEHYTRSDKVVAYCVFFWSFVWSFLLCFVGVIIWNHYHHWPDSWWCTKFLVTMIVAPAIVATITTIWFGLGSIRDLKDMFIRLQKRDDDYSDNGQVLK